MDTSIFTRHQTPTPPQQEALAAISLMVKLAQTVILEHAALPKLHPAQEQEATARNSASALALLVLRINRDLQGLAAIEMN